MLDILKKIGIVLLIVLAVWSFFGKPLPEGLSTDRTRILDSIPTQEMIVKQQYDCGNGVLVLDAVGLTTEQACGAKYAPTAIPVQSTAIPNDRNNDGPTRFNIGDNIEYTVSQFDNENFTFILDGKEYRANDLYLYGYVENLTVKNTSAFEVVLNDNGNNWDNGSKLAVGEQNTWDTGDSRVTLMKYR